VPGVCQESAPKFAWRPPSQIRSSRTVRAMTQTEDLTAALLTLRRSPITVATVVRCWRHAHRIGVQCHHCDRWAEVTWIRGHRLVDTPRSRGAHEGPAPAIAVGSSIAFAPVRYQRRHRGG
jgi:hypothetical protein